MSMNAAHDDAYTKLDFVLDDGICRRAAIGLVVLATDHTIEHEWRKLLTQDGVAFYESRVYNSADITPERLMEMESRIAAAVALIRPGERIDVVAFGCTSASMVIGEETVFERIHEARPGVACTTPITAADVVVPIERMSVLTLLADDISEKGTDAMMSAGIAP